MQLQMVPLIGIVIIQSVTSQEQNTRLHNFSHKTLIFVFLTIQTRLWLPNHNQPRPAPIIYIKLLSHFCEVTPIGLGLSGFPQNIDKETLIL